MHAGPGDEVSSQVSAVLLGLLHPKLSLAELLSQSVGIEYYAFLLCTAAAANCRQFSHLRVRTRRLQTQAR